MGRNAPSAKAISMRGASAKTLFSRHYLEHRLADHPEWKDDPRPTFDQVCALWQTARQYGDTWNEAQTEEEFVKATLSEGAEQRQQCI